MKTAVAIAASVLMLAAFAARAATEPPVESPGTSPVLVAEASRPEARAVEAEPVVETSQAETVSEKAVEPAPAAVPQEKAGAPGTAGARRIAGQLARELDLSPVQRSSVESILHDRDRELEAYFAEIRARKVHTLEDWSRRIAGIKEGSYRRIQAVLDARQAAAFQALLERKSLKDTIAFRIPDDVVNLDDFKD